MAKIIVDPNKSIEIALAKFKKQVEQEGILKEYRSRCEYTKPSVKKKQKSIAARQQLKKSQRRTNEKH